MLENTDEATCPITNKLPDKWDSIFKNRRELPPQEFQFSIRKRWISKNDCSERDNKVNNNSPTECLEGYRKVKNNSPTDRLEGDRKLNNNEPSYQIEEAYSSSIETNIPPQREQVGASSLKNNNSGASMA